MKNINKQGIKDAIRELEKNESGFCRGKTTIARAEEMGLVYIIDAWVDSKDAEKYLRIKLKMGSC